MSWLNGSAAVMALTFDVDAEAPLLAQDMSLAAHAGLMSHQRFGPDVGVPRILDLLDDLGVRATFFVPGVTAERHPGAVEAILERGHEVGHHSYAHHRAIDLTEEQEREDFERALAVLTDLGAQVRGHRTPLSSASMRTAGLVAEHGLVYESTLMDDDRPYVLDTGRGDIVELPPFWGLDDWLQYVFLPVGEETYRVKVPEDVVAGWTLELEAMRREGCLCVLTLHPFVSGRPGRLLALRGLIEHALEAGDVEVLTCGEIADRARADPDLPRRDLARLDPRPSAELYPVL